MVTPPPAPKPKSVPKPMPKPVISPPLVPPIVKPVLEKKVEPVPKVEEVKRTLLDESKKTFATKSTEENNVTKVAKVVTKKVVKKKVRKKKVVKKQKTIKKKPSKKTRVVKPRRAKPNRTKRSNDPLANMLMGSGTSMFPTQAKRTSGTGNYGERMIKELYGSEFNTYSPTQKKYIRNNLSTIHRITQRTLTRNGYPQVAIQTKQQGTNVVSFYLHPNGDITGLRLKKRIGYSALDNNTLKVIKLAYKDYPLPNKKTRLIFYVRYSIY